MKYRILTIFICFKSVPMHALTSSELLREEIFVYNFTPMQHFCPYLNYVSKQLFIVLSSSSFKTTVIEIKKNNSS